MAKDPNKKALKEQRKAAKKEKKGKRAMAAQAQKNKKEKRGGLREYFRGVKTETKKVVWPTRKELISYTGVVLFTCVIFGLAIWGIDSAFLALLRTILQISF